MQNKFDELAKGLAQSVTRRQALKRFGVGLAGMALACFGLTNRARAATVINGYCEASNISFTKKEWVLTGLCVGVDPATGACWAGGGCQAGQKTGSPNKQICSTPVSQKACSFTI